MQHTVDLATMPSAVADFARYKSVIQNCSPKTVNEYVLDLRTFFRFLRAKKQGIDPAADPLPLTGWISGISPWRRSPLSRLSRSTNL